MKMWIKILIGVIVLAVIAFIFAPHFLVKKEKPAKQSSSMINRSGSGHYTTGKPSKPEKQKSPHPRIIYMGESTEGLLNFRQ